MRRTALPLLALLSGCAPGKPPVRVEEIRAPRLTAALPRPSFTLERLDGTPYDFGSETRGTLTYLFFGYTKCPDVCPLHMANLAGALRAVPPDVRAAVKVVFVTTDPDRDTPDVIRTWLASFDSSFVGLRGSAAALEVAQRSMGMPPARQEGELPGGGYGVSHGAHLWAITPDDSVHVVYPMGMTRDDLAADMPRLLQLWPKR